MKSRVVSAHRTPDLLFDYAATARDRGLEVIIAGAGGAAHLPGMTAAKTTLPVLGVPVQSKALNGMDSLLSIVQMPAGMPVGTLAIGASGATNAALLAAAILGEQVPRHRIRRLLPSARSRPSACSSNRTRAARHRTSHEDRHHRRGPARTHAGPLRLSAWGRVPVPRSGRGCAGRSGRAHLDGGFDDAAKLRELAGKVDLVTFDVENVPVDAIREIAASPRRSCHAGCARYVPGPACGEDAVPRARRFQRPSSRPWTRWRISSTRVDRVGLPGDPEDTAPRLRRARASSGSGLQRTSRPPGGARLGPLILGSVRPFQSRGLGHRRAQHAGRSRVLPAVRKHA